MPLSTKYTYKVAVITIPTEAAAVQILVSHVGMVIWGRGVAHGYLITATYDQQSDFTTPSLQFLLCSVFSPTSCYLVAKGRASQTNLVLRKIKLWSRWERRFTS